MANALIFHCIQFLTICVLVSGYREQIVDTRFPDMQMYGNRNIQKVKRPMNEDATKTRNVWVPPPHNNSPHPYYRQPFPTQYDADGLNMYRRNNQGNLPGKSAVNIYRKNSPAGKEDSDPEDIGGNDKMTNKVKVLICKLKRERK